MLRIALGCCLGLLIGVWQMGWTRESQPIVLEYGLVLGSMAFAVTNYQEFRLKLIARTKAPQPPVVKKGRKR